MKTDKKRIKWEAIRKMENEKKRKEKGVVRRTEGLTRTDTGLIRETAGLDIEPFDSVAFRDAKARKDRENLKAVLRSKIERIDSDINDLLDAVTIDPGTAGEIGVVQDELIERLKEIVEAM